MNLYKEIYLNLGKIEGNTFEFREKIEENLFTIRSRDVTFDFFIKFRILICSPLLFK